MWQLTSCSHNGKKIKIHFIMHSFLINLYIQR